MKNETRELLTAMAAVNRKVPDVAMALLDGRLSLERQHEFADLLQELGQLVHEHARNRTAIVLPHDAHGTPLPP